MSLSDIIKTRFKKKVAVNEVKTPQEVAEVIIRDPEEANLQENVDGNTQEQKKYQSALSDIETNRMYAWADMNLVKKNLWNKLHSVKNAMKDSVN